MDGARDQFLSRTALTLDEDRRSTARHFPDEFEDLDHLAAFPNHGRCARTFGERLLKMTMFTHELAVVDGALRD